MPSPYPDPAAADRLANALYRVFAGDPNAALSQDTLVRGGQARADRHNQNLSPEQRQSQLNQDWDHYLVGNEMAGPQYPLHERLGAILPALGHEALRPLISNSPTLVNALNRVFGTPDQPVWIAKGAGAGGAAAEPPVGIEGALRNLEMLYRGAIAGTPPGGK